MEKIPSVDFFIEVFFDENNINNPANVEERNQKKESTFRMIFNRSEN